MILHKNYEIEIDGFKSTWNIHPENTILNVFVPDNRTTRLSGSFAIWEISDTSLIFTKMLTSQQDQVMVYYFTDKPLKRDALVKDAKYVEKREQLKKEAESQEYEEILIDGKKIRVQKLRQQDLFMRKIRPEKGFVYYHTESGKLLKIAAKEE